MNLYYVLKNIFSSNKKILSIRKNWGKKIEKHRNFDLIKIYHNYFSEDSEKEYVDKRTWSDLNFNSIFSLLDRTTSSIGQQFLFHLMHKYESDERKLKSRIIIAKNFSNDSKTRESIQLSLLNINDIGSYYIANILWGSCPTIPKYYFNPLFEIKVVQGSWSESCLNVVGKSLTTYKRTRNAQHKNNIR